MMHCKARRVVNGHIAEEKARMIRIMRALRVGADQSITPSASNLTLPSIPLHAAIVVFF
jgi:hypothetical protein